MADPGGWVPNQENDFTNFQSNDSFNLNEVTGIDGMCWLDAFSTNTLSHGVWSKSYQIFLSTLFLYRFIARHFILHLIYISFYFTLLSLVLLVYLPIYLFTYIYLFIYWSFYLLACLLSLTVLELSYTQELLQVISRKIRS